MEKSILATIQALQFDVTNLHKLTPPEDATLFDLNLGTGTYGGLLINPDGTVTSVTSMSKPDKSLPSFSHWFSSFSVYASIRATYDPTGTIGPALFMFMRDMNHYQLNFPWFQVLRYFFETFRDCQGKPAHAWLLPNVRAYTKFLHHNVAPITLSTPSGSHKPTPAKLSKGRNNAGTEPREPTKKRYTPEEIRDALLCC